MNTSLVVELLEIPMDQLSSSCKTFESPLDMIYLTQRLTQHYYANPEIMNTILIPVKRINSPASSLSRVTPRRHYEVLGNYHIFFARKKAQCPLARCLCLNRSEEQTDEIWQTELQIQPGKPNITAMNQEELQQAFDYLIKEKLGKREKVLPDLLNHEELIPKLVNDSSRPYWSSWKPFEALAQTLVSSKIDKRHTDYLDQYFCFTPAPTPVPNTVPFLLQQMTMKELRREADERRLAHKGMKKAGLVRLLSGIQ